MNKPNNYDNTKVGGDFEPVQLGAHRCKIVSVEETKSKKGADMIIVRFDFNSKDVQPNYFKNIFDKDGRDEKKWPIAGTQYIMVNDEAGKTSKSFKAFCTAFEDSNNTDIVWGDNFASQFKSKMIGVVFGEVEEYYQDALKTRRKPRWFCDIKKVDETGVPDKKYFKGDIGTQTTTGDIWMSIPEGEEDGLPFN